MKQHQTLLKSYFSNINELKYEIEKLKTRQAEIEIQMTDKYNEFISNVKEALDIHFDKIYTLRFPEYRQDMYHCFQAAQSLQVIVTGLKLSYDNGFIYPIVEKPLFTSNGNLKRSGGIIKTKALKNINWYCSWELLDENENILLSYKSEEVIIPNTYSKDELNQLRNRALSIQRL